MLLTQAKRPCLESDNQGMKTNHATRNVGDFIINCRQKATGRGAPKVVRRTTLKEAAEEATRFFEAKYGGEWEPIQWARTGRRIVWKRM
jgi:hypothetical protein